MSKALNFIILLGLETMWTGFMMILQPDWTIAWHRFFIVAGACSLFLVANLVGMLCDE